MLRSMALNLINTPPPINNIYEISPRCHKIILEYADKFRSFLIQSDDVHLSCCSFLILVYSLPAYLAAAFAKKLSRLALVVPPSGALVIIALIHNLLRRHPSINCLVHQVPIHSNIFMKTVFADLSVICLSGMACILHLINSCRHLIIFLLEIVWNLPSLSLYQSDCGEHRKMSLPFLHLL
jgi:hypothetical protein